MPRATFFVQECPICGRNLQVRVEYLGRKVVCQHCLGNFTAYDPDGRPATPCFADHDLLERAERLLASEDLFRYGH